MQLDFRQLLLKAYPDDKVGSEHFEVSTCKITDVSDGQILLKSIYLAIEPLLRGRIMKSESYATPVNLGERMVGRAISIVVESKHPGFSIGDIVESWAGWTEYSVATGDNLRKVPSNHRPLPLAMSVLGSSGISAYLSLFEAAKLQPGETILVTSAAGATGSIAVQLGKLVGANVVAVAGGEAKCKYVLDELQADSVIDYKSEENFEDNLRLCCPGGIDVFWDCIGDERTQYIMANMNTFGRVVIFGSMMQYSNPRGFTYPIWDSRIVLTKRLTLSGFLQSDYTQRHEQVRSKLYALSKQGKLSGRYFEYQGLDAAPTALADLIQGKHMGKIVVRVSECPDECEKDSDDTKMANRYA